MGTTVAIHDLYNWYLSIDVIDLSDSTILANKLNADHIDVSTISIGDTDYNGSLTATDNGTTSSIREIAAATSGSLAGWNINSTEIYSSAVAPTIAADGHYKGEAGIVMGSDGSLRSPSFYIDADGAGFKGSLQVGVTTLTEENTLNSYASAAAVDSVKDITLYDLGSSSVSGTTVSSSGSSSWEAGVASSETYNDGVEASCVITADDIDNARFMFGLSDGAVSGGNPESHYSTIDYAFYVNSGLYYIRRKGNNQGSPSNLPVVSVGDKIKVSYDGGIVKYYVNGREANQTSAIFGTNQTLRLQVSFYNSGGLKTLSNCKLEPFYKPNATNGKVGGWNIQSNAIYTGTANSWGYAPANSMTILSTGTIHTPHFYSQANGAGFKGAVTAGAGSVIAGAYISDLSVTTIKIADQAITVPSKFTIQQSWNSGTGQLQEDDIMIASAASGGYKGGGIQLAANGKITAASTETRIRAIGSVYADGNVLTIAPNFHQTRFANKFNNIPLIYSFDEADLVGAIGKELVLRLQSDDYSNKGGTVTYTGSLYYVKK